MVRERVHGVTLLLVVVLAVQSTADEHTRT